MTSSPAAHPQPADRWNALIDGPQLRHLRHQHGLSQEQLADQAGLSAATVARLERQPRAACRSRTLGRLAAALGQPPAHLIPPPMNTRAATRQRSRPPTVAADG